MSDSLEKLIQLLNEGNRNFGQASRILSDVFSREYSFTDSKGGSSSSRDLFTRGAVAALQCKANAKVSSNRNNLPLTAPSVFRNVTSVDDLLTCTDAQFNLHVNACRYTIRTIFDAIKLLEPSFQYNDLLMLIWYLSSELNNLNKVAKMFHIPTDVNPLKKLEEVASHIYRLKRNSRMYLAEVDYEEDDIVSDFEQKTNLPNVLGALCVFGFKCLDGSSVSVLVVCDQTRNFRHLGLNCNHHIIEDVIRNDPIYERLLQDHPRGYSYYCPSVGYPTLPQLFPGLTEDDLKCSSLFPEIPHFGFAHNDVVDVVRISVREMISRFPKLNSLDKASNPIMTSAFILHNFCNQIQIMERKRMQQKTS